MGIAREGKKMTGFVADVFCWILVRACCQVLYSESPCLCWWPSSDPQRSHHFILAL